MRLRQQNCLRKDQNLLCASAMTDSKGVWLSFHLMAELLRIFFSREHLLETPSQVNQRTGLRVKSLEDLTAAPKKQSEFFVLQDQMAQQQKLQKQLALRHSMVRPAFVIVASALTLYVAFARIIEAALKQHTQSLHSGSSFSHPVLCRWPSAMWTGCLSCHWQSGRMQSGNWVFLEPRKKPHPDRTSRPWRRLGWAGNVLVALNPGACGPLSCQASPYPLAPLGLSPQAILASPCCAHVKKSSACPASLLRLHLRQHTDL